MLGLIEIFIFLCIIYYIVGKNRTGTMVDMLSTRLHGVYNSWHTTIMPEPETQQQIGNNQQLGAKLSEHQLPVVNRYRFSNENKIKNIHLERESEKVNCDESLFALKKTQMVDLPPTFQNKFHNGQIDDIFRCKKNKPNSLFDLDYYFPHLMQTLRVKKYKFAEVSDEVLKDNELEKVIEEATLDTLKEKMSLLKQYTSDEEQCLYEEILKKQHERAKKILLAMRCKMSNLLLQLTGWLVYKIVPHVLSGVATYPKQMEMLRSLNEKHPNTPLVFVPLHRSHLDYVLVTFMLLNNNVRCPVIAAGNNLKIPFFGKALGGLGAFFIKRRIDSEVGKKDIIYRTVLHTYIKKCMMAGHNLEFFIEGGRTRTGKPNMPKIGILSVVVDALMDGTIADALLVPVSVNYERLVDGNFVAEQLGQKKKPETFFSAIGAIWNAVNARYGLMRIDFNNPISLKGMVDSFQQLAPQTEMVETRELPQQNSTKKLMRANASMSSLHGTDVAQEEHRDLIDSIARNLVYYCTNATPVMATNATAFLLLHKFREGVLLSQLIESFDSLRDSLRSVKDLGFTGNSRDVILYAADLLGSDIIRIDDTQQQNGDDLFIKADTSPAGSIELSYYSNTLVPHFAVESILATCLLRHATPPKKQTADRHLEIIVNLDDFNKDCFDFCDILRNEFILCKPEDNIEYIMENVLTEFNQRKLISIVDNARKSIWHNETEKMVQEAFDHNDQFDKPTSQRTLQINLTEANVKHLRFLSNILAPIVFTYLSTAKTVCQLIDNSVIENDLTKMCLARLQTSYKDGNCPYGESLSVDYIRNSLKVFHRWSVLEYMTGANVKLLSIAPQHSSDVALHDFVQRIEKYCLPKAVDSQLVTQ